MIERAVAGAVGWVERKLARQAPVILAYHRVTDPTRDVWGITVGPDRFTEQIEALVSVRRVVPLGDLLAASRAPPVRGERPLAAVTFDDGYRDVFDTARPILHRLNCPATVFIVSGMVGAAREFWWDELAFIFLAPHPLPALLEAILGGRRRCWEFSEIDPGARAMACHQIRRCFRDMKPAAIEAHLAELRTWAGVDRPARAENRAMSEREVAAIDDGLLSIGAHTVSHASLPFLSRAERRAEIADSRRACEALVNRPVEHLAYPFGAYDWRAAASAREAGCVCACTTVPGVVRRGTDLFRLPRLAPGQLDGASLARALS